MAFEELIIQNLNLFIFLIVLIAIWECVWKAIALWFSSRRKQLIWFIFILIINSMGILPIIYLLIYRKKKRR